MQTKTENICILENDCGRCTKAPLTKFCTDAERRNLTYSKIIIQCLDQKTAPVKDYLHDKRWVALDQSDNRVGMSMQDEQLDNPRRHRYDNELIFTTTNLTKSNGVNHRAT